MGIFSSLFAFAFVFVASLSSLIFRLNIWPRANAKNVILKEHSNHFLLNLLMLLSIFGCASYISIFFVHIRSYESIALYYYYSRVAELNELPLVDVNWLLAQIPPLGFVTSLFVFVEGLSDKSYKPKVYLMVLLFVFTGVSLSITGTRSVLIIFLLLLLFIFLGLRRLSATRYIVTTFIVFALYLLSAYFMRASEVEKETLGIVDIFKKYTLLYIFGGIKGFDAYLSENLNVYHQQFAAMFGLQISEVMDFVNLGPDLEGNVYSAFSVYLYYFGYLGALCLVFLVFTIVGFVYEYRYQNVLLFLISCFATVATVLSVFHDYFFALFPYIGRVILIYLILYSAKSFRNIMKKLLIT
jgi:oligosaccharide repeat unit polymerase